MPFTPYIPKNNTSSTGATSGFTPYVPGQKLNTGNDSGTSKYNITGPMKPFKSDFWNNLFGLKNLKNITDPANKQDLRDVSTGAAQSAGSTLVGTGQLVSKPLSHIPGKVGSFFGGGEKLAEDLQEGPLKPKNDAQQVGKTAGDIAQFFIPSGPVGATEKVITGALEKGIPSKVGQFFAKTAAKSAIRGTEAAGVTALQTGGDGKATGTAGIVGAAIPVASPLIRKTAELFGGATKRVAGALSGRGSAVIDEILKDPKSALEGLIWESIDTLSRDSKTLKNAVVGMKTDAGKEYSRVLNNLQSIYENEGKSFDKGTEINKALGILEDKFGITTAGKVAEVTGEAVDDAGKLDFESSRFLPKEASVIERAMKILKSFRDPMSPKTMESLASKIDKLKSQSPSAVETNSAIHAITSSLRESVAKMGEEAGYQEGADLARNFAQAMDKIDNFTSLFKATAEDLRPDKEVTKIGELRKGQNVILPESEKTKIIQDLSTLFSGNKDVYKDILRKMVFGGQELLSRQAGRSMATASEKASTKLGDFIREVLIAPVLSPKSIGIIAARTGQTIEKASKFMNILKKLSPAARGTIIELISKHNKN